MHNVVEKADQWPTSLTLELTIIESDNTIMKFIFETRNQTFPVVTKQPAFSNRTIMSTACLVVSSILNLDSAAVIAKSLIATLATAVLQDALFSTDERFFEWNTVEVAKRG